MAEEKRHLRLFDSLAKVTFTWDLFWRITIFVVLVILLGLMFPHGEAIELDYKVGAVWAQEDLNAPYSFPIHRDPREYQADVDEAIRNTYPVFERDEQSTAVQMKNLADASSGLLAVMNTRKNELTRKPARQFEPDSVFLRQLNEVGGGRLSMGDAQILVRLFQTGKIELFQTQVEQFVASQLRAGILDREKKSLTRNEIALRKGTTEEIISLQSLYDGQSASSQLKDDIAVAAQWGDELGSLAGRLAANALIPNIRYNASETELSIKAAVDAVPRTAGFLQKDERIVSRNERITQETKLKLESLRKEKADRGSDSAGPLQLLGTVLHVSIVLMLYGIYFYLFRKKIFGDTHKLGLIAILILMEGFFAYLTRETRFAGPVEYLILVPAASMLLTIIFDSRVGFYGTVIIAYVVGGVRGNDYSIALASLIAGALSVYTVRDVKNRTQILRSLVYIFLGYALTIFALALERFESPQVVLEQLMFALANALISPMLTYGLLIFFERFFKVTTDLTLIELSHFNHPLLRMLAERAPGTYHHSMTMASLAEAAASVVGANEVLARVGAYFHDIGKIDKPTYFVENQKGTRNRHEKLSPRMSSLIICNHVKEGVALAQEYNLPEEVIAFIPMHHGTTRIEFFYQKALQQAESSSDESKRDEIKESDYRYPGPKPQTKETGILMLADTLEAAARTLEDPSPQRLEMLIEDLVRRRFEEGELDECPLTLKDLTRMKLSFLGVLVGIYHSRIKYPDAGKKKEGKSEGGDGSDQRSARAKKVPTNQ